MNQPLRSALLAVVSVLVPISVHADIVTIGTKTQTFNNARCAATDSCDLKDFTVRQEDYKLTVPSQGITAYGTRMHAFYDTSSVDSLKKYGIVQFIKGCQFDSERVNGKVVNRRTVAIEHYGEVVPFYFPQEVIDGFVKDPIDWGAEDGMPSRHFFYLNKFVGSQTPRPEDYYGNQKPSTPRLYLRDMPGIAQMYDGTARNLSVQFRLCIYKSADVPKVVADHDVNFATPLQCFGWNSSFVYNFETGDFDRPSGLVDFCQ